MFLYVLYVLVYSYTSNVPVCDYPYFYVCNVCTVHVCLCVACYSSSRSSEDRVVGAVSVALTNERRTLERWRRSLGAHADDCRGAHAHLERHLVPRLQRKLDDLLAQLAGAPASDGRAMDERVEDEEGPRSPSDARSITESSRSTSRMSYLYGYAELYWLIDVPTSICLTLALSLGKNLFRAIRFQRFCTNVSYTQKI